VTNPNSDAPDPRRRRPREVEYKGAPLDADRGPGLGCFWIQLVALGILLVLTPLSVAWNWPVWASGLLLVVVLLLLLFAGQTVIFLLRLVAADRRAAGRRRPLGSATKTVGEIEDEDARHAEDADLESAAEQVDLDEPAGGRDATPNHADETPDRGVRE
jgi:hypothetical protein